MHEKRNPNDCVSCLSKLKKDYEALLHQYCIKHDTLFIKNKDSCYWCTYNKSRIIKKGDSLEPAKEFRPNDSDDSISIDPIRQIDLEKLQDYKLVKIYSEFNLFS